MYEKFLQTSAELGFTFKPFSKSSNLSIKGLDKPGKASKLTQSSSGNFIERICDPRRQPFAPSRK